MHRIRKVGHHRGWTLAQMTREAIARDIARDIATRRAQGDYQTISEYTQNIETAKLVFAILEKDGETS